MIFVFDDKAHPEAIDTPKEHSPENHIFFHTYHYSDDLNTITEEQVRNNMLEVIQNVGIESIVHRVVPRGEGQTRHYARSYVLSGT